MEDGIYFDLDQGTYHEQPRLSASGICDMLVSIPTYWANSALNPDRETVDKDTFARILGRAYHTAMLEPDKLRDRFVQELDREDYPEALMNDTAVKEALAEIGLPKTKTGELAGDRAMRLMEAGYSGEIWSVLQADWEDERGDRQPIAAKYWRQIERDIQRIADNPEIAEKLGGGFAEVSVFWTDPATGIPMKARFDKLKPDYFLDLKSFQNPQGKPVNRCIIDQIMYNRYYIQARFYQRAVEAIKALDLGSGGYKWHPLQARLVEDIKTRTVPHRCFYLFQEKGGVPNLLLREIGLEGPPTGHDWNSIGADYDGPMAQTVLAIKADVEINHAIKLYQQAIEAYGTEQPWYPFDMVDQYGDDDFPEFFLASKPV